MTISAHADVEHHRGWWRRLDLVGPAGRFLVRRGIDLRLFGIYLHHIEDRDPGLDLHDHPWPFISIVLTGGYTEEWTPARDAPLRARLAEDAERNGVPSSRGTTRTWRRGSIHRMRLTDAHRIVSALPGTFTLVLRGRKSRRWGFYLPSGYVDQALYDYEDRRPVSEAR